MCINNIMDVFSLKKKIVYLSNLHDKLLLFFFQKISQYMYLVKDR